MTQEHHVFVGTLRENLALAAPPGAGLDEIRSALDAVDALESLETDSTVQVPLGGGAYVRATVEDIDEVIVDIGGGFAAEQEQEGATETLQTKRNTLSERIDETEAEISELESEIEEVEQRAQQVQQQAQQQAMQQLQQGNDEQ